MALKRLKNSRRKPEANLEKPFHAVALYDLRTPCTESLSFCKGDIIRVYSILSSGWCEGVLCSISTRGWFLCNYVRVLDEEEVEKLLAKSS